MEPRVSVIVAAYNAAPYLGECLTSVLAQAGVPFEVIVVDDGSTDGTAGVAQSFPVHYVHQPNSGTCSVPRNNGARLARGEFLVFFDADDVMCPGRLERQGRFLASASGCQVAVCDYRNFAASGKEPASHFERCSLLLSEGAGSRDELILPGGRARAILVDENFAIAGSMMARAQWFRASDGFDQDLRASEDFHMVYRAALAGDIGIQSFVGFRRRLHDLNMSRDDRRILAFKARSRERLSSLEPDRSVRRALRCSAASFYLGLARELWPDDRTAGVMAVLRSVRLRRAPTGDACRVVLGGVARDLTGWGR